MEKDNIRKKKILIIAFIVYVITVGVGVSSYVATKIAKLENEVQSQQQEIDKSIELIEQCTTLQNQMADELIKTKTSLAKVIK